MMANEWCIKSILNQILLLFLFTISFFAILKVEGRVNPQYSLIPNFPLDQVFIEQWQLRGSAYSLGDRIRLTAAEPNRAGMASNLMRVKLLTYFELSVDFNVHSSEFDGGEGFAIWLTSKPIEFGSTFGGPQKWEGLAILFETNQRGEFSDPKISVHSNGGSTIYNGKSTLVTSCSYPIKQLTPDSKSSVYLLLEHDNLHIFAKNKEGWKECINNQKVHFPSDFFVSITASTSAVSDFHDIFSLSISATEEIDTEEESFNRPPLSMIAPFIIRKHEFVDRLIAQLEDDEDIVCEIQDLIYWCNSQLESLQYTVGAQLIDLNYQLDQLTDHSGHLSWQLHLLGRLMNEITQGLEISFQFADELSLSPDILSNYNPLIQLQSNLQLVDDASLSLSEQISSMYNEQNNKNSKEKKMNREQQIETYLVYVVFGFVAIAVVLMIIAKLNHSPSRSKSFRHQKLPYSY